jgi:hypothetical protein
MSILSHLGGLFQLGRISAMLDTARVLNYIFSYRARHGISPTIREIQAHFGFRSTCTVQQIINDLVESGALRRMPTKARSIAPAQHVIYLPILGELHHDSPYPTQRRKPQRWLPIDQRVFNIADDESPFSYIAADNWLDVAMIKKGDIMIFSHKTIGRKIFLYRKEGKIIFEKENLRSRRIALIGVIREIIPQT